MSFWSEVWAIVLGVTVANIIELLAGSAFAIAFGKWGDKP